MGNKATRSFTLIELLVVIVTIGILALLAYPAYTGLQKRAKATKDMNNLRQIGIATQLYMNDNDGTLFSPAAPWMSQLHPKYLQSWNIFLSPFDSPVVSPRTTSEDDTNAAVSYGFNPNAKSSAGASLLSSNIRSPSVFILFAPAQDSTATCQKNVFTGTASQVAPGVTVLGGNNQAVSSPGGIVTVGTHSNCQYINACMADSHVENILWSTFTSDTPDAGSVCPSGTPTASFRWHPDPCQ
jgi:prepilin-type N-terminal cleavage/methylation domain-containing protein